MDDRQFFCWWLYRVSMFSLFSILDLDIDTKQKCRGVCVCVCLCGDDFFFNSKKNLETYIYGYPFFFSFVRSCNINGGYIAENLCDTMILVVFYYDEILHFFFFLVFWKRVCLFLVFNQQVIRVCVCVCVHHMMMFSFFFLLLLEKRDHGSLLSIDRSIID